MVDQEIIRRLEFFHGLTDDQIVRLADLGRVVEFKRDHEIFREDQEAKDFYILLQGRVALLIDIGNSRRTIVYTVTRHQPFSWSGIVEPGVLTSTARAVEDSVALAFSGEELMDLLEEDPSLGFAVICRIAKLIAARLKDSRLQLLSLMHG